jgi:hypothetical protein
MKIHFPLVYFLISRNKIKYDCIKYCVSIQKTEKLIQLYKIFLFLFCVKSTFIVFWQHINIKEFIKVWYFKR